MVEAMKSLATIGMGSNQGNRLHTLQEAINAVRKYGEIVAISSLYKSRALLPDGAPSSWNHDFLNGVFQLSTPLSAHELLIILQQIEDALGRDKTGHWSPRTIDLDILLYNEEVITTPTLTIPHPEAQKRDFVMIPLVEIAPTLRWPNPPHPSVTEIVAQQNFTPNDALVKQQETLS